MTRVALQLQSFVINTPTRILKKALYESSRTLERGETGPSLVRT